MTAIPAGALPIQIAYIHLGDDTAFDQSDWRRGALHTRVLDPDVGPRLHRVSWTSVRTAVKEAIVAHYENYATGTGGTRQFEILLPGSSPGSEVVALWAGPPVCRAASNGAWNVDATLEFATSQDLNQEPGEVERDTEDGTTRVLESGVTRYLQFGKGTKPVAL